MLSFTSRRPLTRDDSFVADSCLLITTGTFQKLPFIAGDHRKSLLMESLDFNSYKADWRLIGWVVLDNHYHIIAQTPPGDRSRVAHVMQSAHSFCAHHWRKDDPSIRNRIWWNYWETPLDDQPTLLRTLNYLHDNPRFHGLTATPADYPASSYSSYLTADPALIADWEAQHPAAAAVVNDQF